MKTTLLQLLSFNPGMLVKPGKWIENTILGPANHGTVKLATKYIPKDNWTKDIEVKDALFDWD